MDRRRLPAEWERQSGVQLTWPHSDTEWYELDKVLDCYVDIAAAILRFEPLMIVARDIEEAATTNVIRYLNSAVAPKFIFRYRNGTNPLL